MSRDAYLILRSSDGWQSLLRYAQEELALSVKRGDSKSLSTLTLAEVGEEIGIRKGIFKLIQHVDYMCQKGTELEEAKTEKP